MSRSCALLRLLITLVLGAAATSLRAAPPASPSVGLELVAAGLNSPLTLVSSDDGTGRLFVVDQAGRIFIIGDTGLNPVPFLDVSASLPALNPVYDERGLLGLAFHPRYAVNGRFFVHYSIPLRAGAPAGYDHTERFSELHVSLLSPDLADPTSERVVLEIDKPQSNHNGGSIVFDREGLLYISMGDGGGANDTGMGHDPATGNGQSIHTLLGKILRIDIDHAQPYAIPKKNPFVGRDGLDEIYAYGLRNPYRMSFDGGGDRALYVGDAGQELFEEVSIVERGGNYGWNLREGRHCFDPQDPANPPTACSKRGYLGEKLVDPPIEYPHSGSGVRGTAVIGGHVYRGHDVDAFRRDYVFGDYTRSFVPPDGSLLVARPEGKEKAWTVREVTIATNLSGRVDHYILGFGEDDDGELYVLVRDTSGPTGTTGQVYKIVPAP